MLLVDGPASVEVEGGSRVSANTGVRVTVGVDGAAAVVTGVCC